MSSRDVIALVLVIFLVGVGLSVVTRGITPIGGFPQRDALNDLDSYREALEMYDGFTQDDIDEIMEINRPDNFGRQSISTSFLDNSLGGVPAAYEGTGATNVVTGILWDYRGYDTLGEATVIFVAVAGVAALFRGARKEEEE